MRIGTVPFLNAVPLTWRLQQAGLNGEVISAPPRELTSLLIDGHLDAFNDRSPSQWANEVPKWESIGAGYVSLNTMRCGFTNSSQHINAIRQFKEALG